MIGTIRGGGGGSPLNTSEFLGNMSNAQPTNSLPAEDRKRTKEEKRRRYEEALEKFTTKAWEVSLPVL